MYLILLLNLFYGENECNLLHLNRVPPLTLTSIPQKITSEQKTIQDAYSSHFMQSQN